MLSIYPFLIYSPKFLNLEKLFTFVSLSYKHLNESNGAKVPLGHSIKHLLLYSNKYLSSFSHSSIHFFLSLINL